MLVELNGGRRVCLPSSLDSTCVWLFLVEHRFLMPAVSRFRNMKILMFFFDHQPPHFHVRYAKRNCICLLDGSLHIGALPADQLSFVKQWAAVHAREIETNWQLCLAGKNPNNIPGLD